MSHSGKKNLSVFCLYPGLSGRGNFKAAPHIAVAWVLLLARFEESIGDEGQNREIKKKNLQFDQKRSTHKVLAKEEVVTKKKPSALS